MKYHFIIGCVAMAFSLMSVAAAAPKEEIVFVGSGRKNITSFRLDTKTGELTPLGLAADASHPSFLAIAPSGKFLYAVGEGTDGVNAFAIEPGGKLRTLNHQPSGGAGPCYISVDATGKNVLVANYSGGSASVFPVDSSGALGAMSGFFQDHGSSVNPQRQDGPYGHCIITSPDNRYAFLCDLGLDKIMIFKFDAATGALTPNDPAFATVPPGSGPRHIAFHPSGSWAYVINEMAGTLTTFRYDAKRGALESIQTEPLLAGTFHGVNTAAEVAAHPSGKFVYASERGEDTIIVFSCDKKTGRLSFVERVPTGGKTPRNFEIDLTGKFLLAANQDSNTIVVFRIDTKTGRILPTGHIASSDLPMCVKCLAP